MLEKLRMQVSRGRQAKSATEHPGIANALDEIQAQIFKGWQECDPSDKALLEQLKMNQVAIQQLREKLAAHINKGKAAENEIERSKK